MTANLADENPFPVSFADVTAAAKRLQGKAFKTPVLTGADCQQTNPFSSIFQVRELSADGFV